MPDDDPETVSLSLQIPTSMREAVEAALHLEESLSAFVRTAIRAELERRQGDGA